METPTQLMASMAIIKNPWFARGHVENMRPEIQAYGPVIGKLLTEMLLDETGGLLEGCGKASVVGMGGEIEHAQAMTHTLHLEINFAKRSVPKAIWPFQTRAARRIAR